MNKVCSTRRITTQELVFCALFTALIAVGAFIKIMIPLVAFAVTFSLQFFFALMAGFLLGPRNGFLSVALYLFIGLIGIPIFAHGGGFGYLLKPTFGFLIGFAAAAFVVGLLTPNIRTMSVPQLIGAAFVAELAYYACGLVYYFIMFNYVVPGAAGIGLAELMSVWFLSTVLPDFALCVLAAFAVHRLRPHHFVRCRR